MKVLRDSVLAVVSLFLASSAAASVPLGIGAVIDRVVFEPGEEAPERIRVYGAFVFFEAGLGEGSGFTEPAAGFMYFAMPRGADSRRIVREWRDLAAVAGTGEAVAFGRYGFAARRQAVQGTRLETERAAADVIRSGGASLIVHPSSRDSAAPVDYAGSDVGVVRLGGGNYDALEAALEAVRED